MEWASRRIFIAYELDNAESLGELDVVQSSLESILQSMENYQAHHLETVRLIALIPEDLGEKILNITNQAVLAHTSIEYKSISTQSSSYFASKNATLGLATGDDIIIFCDSDCIYEKDFLLKMVEAIAKEDADIAFGKTYANIKDKRLFSRIAALSWQFPPRRSHTAMLGEIHDGQTTLQ